jgi:hypothetical protein
LELVPRPSSKHEKRTAGSACETWTVPAADRTILLCALYYTGDLHEEDFPFH